MSITRARRTSAPPPIIYATLNHRLRHRYHSFQKMHAAMQWEILSKIKAMRGIQPYKSPTKRACNRASKKIVICSNRRRRMKHKERRRIHSSRRSTFPTNPMSVGIWKRLQSRAPTLRVSLPYFGISSKVAACVQDGVKPRIGVLSCHIP